MSRRVTLILNDNSVIRQDETVYADVHAFEFARSMGMDTTDMWEVVGRCRPWTWRWTDVNGNLLIVEVEGTLD